MRALHLPALMAMILSTSAGCGDDTEPPIEPTYENVASVIERSCTFSNVCHGDPAGKADLNFMAAAGDITTVLNDVPACQYDLMPRVDPGNPDNSWLMVKLDWMHDAEGVLQFTPADDWMSSATDPDCESFGRIMPLNAMPTPLPTSEVELFREWIRIGAPGPSGG